jgi:hypothetical protein
MLAPIRDRGKKMAGHVALTAGTGLSPGAFVLV